MASKRVKHVKVAVENVCKMQIGEAGTYLEGLQSYTEDAGSKSDDWEH